MPQSHKHTMTNNEYLNQALLWCALTRLSSGTVLPSELARRAHRFGLRSWNWYQRIVGVYNILREQH